MNELRHLQNTFQAYLLHSHSSFQHDIVSTENVPAQTRLAIYANAFRSRLIEALGANYPMLQAYLGQDQFDGLGEAYLLAHPSSFRSIRWFGDQLSFFLDKQPEYKEYPYLAELAQFEWILTLVFDAENSPVLQMEEMRKISPQDWITMRLQAHASTYRLNLSWNVVQIWQALSEDKIPPQPTRNPSPINWVLWRKELTNQFCSLAEDEAWAIDAMLSGVTFSEICEGLCQWISESEAGMRAASLLKGWIMEGLIAKVAIDF